MSPSREISAYILRLKQTHHCHPQHYVIGYRLQLIAYQHQTTEWKYELK